ncbi:hypothetical protein EVAR_95579_1 [Eumeta japonica]|uniref:HTH CENPB-type domain-containing protein n=1 Tax=Eumeta variegata TaxID=151549 RepID=A0A4C1VK98_EUMVA|nr:hypothetical protein EVAR_95579_1 [Eumeta japonica]
MAPTQSKHLRKDWDEEQMVKAIKMVREKKMGTLKVAKTFNVPRTTLQRLTYKTDLTPEEAAATKLGRKTVLGRQLENVLVEYVLTMESKFYGLTRSDLRRMAYMLAKRNNLPNPFQESGLAGKTWLRLFLKRHKDKLSVRKPTGTSFARAFGFNKDNVNNFFQLLDEIYEKNKYKNKTGKAQKKKPKNKKKKNQKGSDDKDIEGEDEEDVPLDSDTDPDPIFGDVPNSADAECMFYQQLFSENTRGELWPPYNACIRNWLEPQRRIASEIHHEARIDFRRNIYFDRVRSACRPNLLEINWRRSSRDYYAAGEAVNMSRAAPTSYSDGRFLLEGKLASGRLSIFFAILIDYPGHLFQDKVLIYAGGTQQGTKMPHYLNLSGSSKSRNPPLDSPTTSPGKLQEPLSFLDRKSSYVFGDTQMIECYVLDICSLSLIYTYRMEVAMHLSVNIYKLSADNPVKKHVCEAASPFTPALNSTLRPATVCS